jgi:antirestriction protein ArdC
MANVYEVITNRIISLLEQGTVPWKKPWRGEPPKNMVSGKPYRGINVFVLASAGFSSPFWLTYKQARTIGGYVKRGEKGCPVVSWSWLERRDDEGNVIPTEKRIPLVRYYTVFNVQQCSNLDGKVPAPEETKVFYPIVLAEQVVKRMPNPPTIIHREPRAYYRPADDLINMPIKELFSSPEEYYCTLFHELSHATGHRSRMDRAGITELSSFGSGQYSREELVAEIGAAFLCGQCGLENSTLDNSAAYIQGWLARLKEDSRMIVIAAQQAQKAADYILAKHDATDEESSEVEP